MSGQIGIYNGNSQHQQLERELGFELAPRPNQITTDVPEMETVKALADKFYNEQQVGLMILGGGLYRKGERIAMEAEAKLTKLSYLAEQLANGAKLIELARRS